MGLPLALAAIQTIGSGVSAIQGNQNRQKAKGQIDAAYRLGRERLATRQGDQRRTQAESLISRGLTQGGIRLRTRPVQRTNAVLSQREGVTPDGTRIRLNAAIDPTTVRNAPEAVTGARTLGEQQQLDLAREQQVEQDALYQQRNAARAGVDAGYAQGLTGAIGQGVAGAVDAFRLGQVKQQAEQGAFGIDPIAPWEQTRVDQFNTFTQSG